MNDHPGDQVTFLLTHKYPWTLTVDQLKGGDRSLYEALSERYETGLGMAINSFRTHSEFLFSPNELGLRVMGYPDIIALK